MLLGYLFGAVMPFPIFAVFLGLWSLHVVQRKPSHGLVFGSIALSLFGAHYLAFEHIFPLILN